jgi:hypothetical protein
MAGELPDARGEGAEDLADVAGSMLKLGAGSGLAEVAVAGFFRCDELEM